MRTTTVQEERPVVTTERWLKFLLRLNGCGALAFAPAMFMPHAWLVWCVGHVRPALPDLPLVSFLARELAGFYVLLGILLLVFSNDVRRYARPILLTMIWCWLLGGALLLAGLPNGALLLDHRFFRWLYWDMIYGAVMTVVILTLLHRVTRPGLRKTPEKWSNAGSPSAKEKQHER